MSDETPPSHISPLSASLVDRERPQVENHVRSIQVQTLDALLRIEELLQDLIRRAPLSDYEPAPLTPETPAVSKVAEKTKEAPAKGKGRFGRSL